MREKGGTMKSSRYLAIMLLGILATSCFSQTDPVMTIRRLNADSVFAGGTDVKVALAAVSAYDTTAGLAYVKSLIAGKLSPGDSTAFLAYVKSLITAKVSTSDSTTFLAYVKAIKLSISDSTTFLAYVKANKLSISDSTTFLAYVKSLITVGGGGAGVGANIAGAGVGVYRDTVGGAINLKRLKASNRFMTVTDGTDSVLVGPDSTAFLATAYGSSSFTTTGTRKAIYISGLTATDIVVVSWLGLDSEAACADEGTIKAVCKIDSIIVTRNASVTSGAGFSYVRIK